MSDFPKRLKIEVTFDIGEIVYMVTDSNQEKYTVMGYYIRPNETLYEIYSHAYGNYIAYDFEMQRTKDIT